MITDNYPNTCYYTITNDLLLSSTIQIDHRWWFVQLGFSNLDLIIQI